MPRRLQVEDAAYMLLSSRIRSFVLLTNLRFSFRNLKKNQDRSWAVLT